MTGCVRPARLFARLLPAAALLFAAGPAAAAPRPLVVDRGAGCDDGRAASRVDAAHPLCSIARAVEVAAAGGRVLVRRGSYPVLRLRDAHPRGTVTIAPYRGELPRLAGVEIQDSADLRIEGFRITDIAQIDDSERLTFAGNDLTPHGFIARHSSHLRFEGNHVHDLTIDLQPVGAPGARCHSFTKTAGIYPRCGFAFRLIGVSDSVVAANEIDHVPADGVQANGVRNVEIADNFFHDISAFVDPAEHSDGIQLEGDNAHVTVRDNRFQDTRGVLAEPFPDARAPGAATSLAISGNTFFRIRDWAMHLVDAAGARVTANTVWLAGRGVWLSDSTASPIRATGMVVTDNVLCELRTDPGIVAVSRDNLLARGPLLGPGDQRGMPAFADVDAGDLRLADGASRGAPRASAGPR